MIEENCTMLDGLEPWCDTAVAYYTLRFYAITSACRVQ